MRGVSSSSSRTQSTMFSSWVLAVPGFAAGNTTRRPSGDSSIRPISSIVVPAGDTRFDQSVDVSELPPEPKPSTVARIAPRARPATPSKAASVRLDPGAAPTASCAVTPGSASLNSPRSSSAASPISRRRLRGSFTRHFFNTRRTAGGVPAGSLSHSGSRVTTCAITSVTVSPVNIASPVSISNRITPKAQTSVRRSTFLPRACSGDM